MRSLLSILIALCIGLGWALSAQAQAQGKKSSAGSAPQAADAQRNQNANQKNQNDSPQNQNANQQHENANQQHQVPYLGVALQPVHHALLNHLAEVLGEGRGILVEAVAPDSPAAKAGLQPDDILVRYDDQKLYSAEQLVKLVQNDKPGREATLELVRGGKSQTVKVALGHRNADEMPSDRRMSYQGGPFERRTRSNNGSEEESQWRTFDAMTLSRSGNNKFKAEIRYRDQNGKIETRTFEGSREQISKDIENQKDLPANEKSHLLRAVEPNSQSGGPAPGLFYLEEEEYRS